MAHQIIKKSDTEYVLWSSVVDDFVFEGTVQEIIEWMVQNHRHSVAEHVHNVVRQLAAGTKPYYQFTMTYEQASTRRAMRHGKPA